MKYLKIISLFTIAFLLFPLSSQAQQVELEEISPIRAKLMVHNGSLLVDVREKDEVAALAYDVENIINIPLSEFEDKMVDLPKDKHLIIACRSGKRSLKAANILVDNGYTNLANLEGGILAWQKKNLDVITNGKTTKKACCANPNSKDCNPDGTCKKTVKKATKACCSSAKKDGKACCSKKQSN
jgi:rhodanese-related sulfurtransferase